MDQQTNSHTGTHVLRPWRNGPELVGLVNRTSRFQREGGCTSTLLYNRDDNKAGHNAETITRYMQNAFGNVLGDGVNGYYVSTRARAICNSNVVLILLCPYYIDDSDHQFFSNVAICQKKPLVLLAFGVAIARIKNVRPEYSVYKHIEMEEPLDQNTDWKNELGNAVSWAIRNNAFEKNLSTISLEDLRILKHVKEEGQRLEKDDPVVEMKQVGFEEKEMELQREKEKNRELMEKNEELQRRLKELETSASEQTPDTQRRGAQAFDPHITGADLEAYDREAAVDPGMHANIKSKAADSPDHWVRKLVSYLGLSGLVSGANNLGSLGEGDAIDGTDNYFRSGVGSQSLNQKELDVSPKTRSGKDSSRRKPDDGNVLSPESDTTGSGKKDQVESQSSEPERSEKEIITSDYKRVSSKISDKGKGSKFQIKTAKCVLI